MKTTKIVLPIIFPFLALMLFFGTSFKNPGKEILKRPCEATCQFSPTVGDFAAVNFLNCNSSSGAPSVTAGTSFTPVLPGLGCITAVIDISLPAIHPAGTITIERNGVVIITHTTGTNDPFSVSRKVSYRCDDYYIVRFF
jgi:hypothetical protein